ncbi:hypothetical protein EDM68_01075 [Candidatus Uhrbacteria bacterium]|nr:MAG: hypothetical protein EDM68_01075 [Candidatus Uhrbacteria bacterium]
MKPTHILFIHGGMTFRNRKSYMRFLRTRKVSLGPKHKWSESDLDKRLGKKFQITRPRMPCSDHAKYEEWKFHFERYLPLLPPQSILIGESLGGIFLAKYLSEHRFSRPFRSVYLVCPPFDDSLPDEDVVGGFRLKPDLSLLEKNSKKLVLLFSKNDPVVPLSHAKKYEARLENAEVVVYEHIPGHFETSSLPEIVRMIKADASRR